MLSSSIVRRRWTRRRRGALLIGLATSLVLISTASTTATAQEQRADEAPVHLPTSSAACGDGPAALGPASSGPVRTATAAQQAAVAERLLDGTARPESEAPTFHVLPMDVPATSFTMKNTSQGLQIVGRSDSTGILSFDFVHTPGCSSDEVTVHTFPEGTYIQVSKQSGTVTQHHLAEPWALDASGRELPTWFEADGAVLRQVVGATDAQEPIIFDPTYSGVTCAGHFATLDAGQYMDTYIEDIAYCPVYGMLLASSGYTPVWGFEANLANDYGKLMIRQTGECSYLPDTGFNYDFQVPCKAHDFCYDLRRASFSGTVSDYDCDAWFYYFMEANCNDRSGFAASDCRFYRDSAYTAVRHPDVVAYPNPGQVEFYNRGALNCADVEGPSLADDVPLQSWDCLGVSNQRFRIWPAPGAPGYFHIKSVYSGKCVRATSSSDRVTQETCNDSYYSMRMYIQGALNDNQYSIREQNSRGADCWHVPGNSYANGTNLDHVPCNDYSSWYLWRIFDA